MTLSDKGEIAAIGFGEKQAVRDIRGSSVLDGCIVKDVRTGVLPGGGMQFTKTIFHEKGKRSLTLVEQFRPTATSIRWEIEVRDNGEPWSTAIQTRLAYPVTGATRFWTAWADPRRAVAGRMNREELLSAGIVPGVEESGDWADPLMPLPLGKASFWYGAPPYRYDKTGIPFCPFVVRKGTRYGGEQVFCIPVATLIDTDQDTGLSLVLSPEDLLLDMSLTTDENGSVTFSRFFHRLGRGKPVRFAMDLVAHEGDWRSALNWMTRRYNQFFDPPIPKLTKSPERVRTPSTGPISTRRK